MSESRQKGVPLSNFPIIQDHKLTKAMGIIDWESLKKPNLFKNGFVPLQPLRRVFGLLILEHMRGVHGEELLQQWLEVPMMQYFTGEQLFHWELPISNDEILMCKNQLNHNGCNLLDSMIKEAQNIS